jgi:hypothetical protein
MINPIQRCAAFMIAPLRGFQRHRPNRNEPSASHGVNLADHRDRGAPNEI